MDCSKKHPHPVTLSASNWIELGTADDPVTDDPQLDILPCVGGSRENNAIQSIEAARVPGRRVRSSRAIRHGRYASSSGFLREVFSTRTPV
jgi:hypothetical protein